MPTRNVNLTRHLDRFIEKGVASGRFRNASQAVHQGLRLLEQREKEDRARIAWLRGAARKGADSIDRGEGLEFAAMDDLAAYVHRVGEEVAGKLTAGRKPG